MEIQKNMLTIYEKVDVSYHWKKFETLDGLIYVKQNLI